MHVVNNDGNDTLYRVIPEAGKHLAYSQDTAGAYRGVYLDNETNRPCGAAELVPVPSNESSDNTGVSSAGTAIVATIATAAIIEIGKAAAPHVKKWALEKAVPWVKQKWSELKGDKPNEAKDAIRTEPVMYKGFVVIEGGMNNPGVETNQQREEVCNG